MSTDKITNNFPQVQQAMQRFVETQPLVASMAIISNDGVLIGGFPKDADSELSLGAMVSSAMAAAPTIVGELNSTKLFSLVVLADKGGILFYQLPDELVLSVKLKKPGKIGVLFGACQQFIKENLT